MNNIVYNLLLADDDSDDRMFFQEALEELSLSSALLSVNDGVELMEFLADKNQKIPDMIFMDLNMPKKTGFECLTEIRTNAKLKHISVIILSTSFDINVIHTLHEHGANHYIRKPSEFSKLKEAIFQAIKSSSTINSGRPELEKFVI